ncbi:MAG TPA: hypothetical protein VH414_20880 [Lichenihabitans sp.]|nr:hypothetical protein [Lichenihabitans sp.]
MSEAAVRALWEALVAGGGRQAQFSHADLGGMGQWSHGMVQIGDMSNDALKAKVSAACADLVQTAAEGRDRPASGQCQEKNDGSGTGRTAATPPREAWWPGDLGRPASVGAQDRSRYAIFPETRRLAVERDGHVTIYDTGAHRIFGVSQQQSTCSAIAFTSQTGPVMLDALRIVDAPRG